MFQLQVRQQNELEESQNSEDTETEERPFQRKRRVCEYLVICFPSPLLVAVAYQPHLNCTVKKKKK